MTVSDAPGGLYDQVEKLSGADVNIEYMYAFATTSGNGARVVLKGGQFETGRNVWWPVKSITAMARTMRTPTAKSQIFTGRIIFINNEILISTSRVAANSATRLVIFPVGGRVAAKSLS